MANELLGKRVAILATDGFEEVELFEPRKALREAGAICEIISVKAGSIVAWNMDNWGESIEVDHTVSSVLADAYDALLIPGGLMSPDRLRTNKDAVRFVRDFFEEGKPVAAICHGPWVLIEADVVRGRNCTSYESIKTDMINAGALWEDSECVVDAGLVTSRKPGDIPAFNRKMVEEFREGVHAAQAAKTGQAKLM